MVTRHTERFHFWALKYILNGSPAMRKFLERKFSDSENVIIMTKNNLFVILGPMYTDIMELMFPETLRIGKNTTFQY
jgi:hypothetical protein